MNIPPPQVWYASRIYSPDEIMTESFACSFSGDVFAGGNGITITLMNPAQEHNGLVVAQGRYVRIFNVGEYDMTVAVDAGMDTWPVKPGTCATFVCHHSEWVLVVADSLNVMYDNTSSGMTSTNAQDAIDELATGKADKASEATENNLAKLDAAGNLADSGKSLSDLQDVSEKGAANGYAGLGSDGKVPSEQLPGSGAYDHGGLAGLGDDDHSQYHNDARGDARYSQLGHHHDASYAPISKGVTNGDSHDHSGGDGAQIAYTSLSGAPTIPDKLADLSDDSTHRLVTDAEKSAWNGKQAALEIPLPVASGGTGASSAVTARASLETSSRPVSHWTAYKGSSGSAWYKILTFTATAAGAPKVLDLSGYSQAGNLSGRGNFRLIVSGDSAAGAYYTYGRLVYADSGITTSSFSFRHDGSGNYVLYFYLPQYTSYDLEAIRVWDPPTFATYSVAETPSGTEITITDET